MAFPEYTMPLLGCPLSPPNFTGSGLWGCIEGSGGRIRLAGAGLVGFLTIKSPRVKVKVDFPVPLLCGQPDSTAGTAGLSRPVVKLALLGCWAMAGFHFFSSVRALPYLSGKVRMTWWSLTEIPVSEEVGWWWGMPLIPAPGTQGPAWSTE